MLLSACSAYPAKKCQCQICSEKGREGVNSDTQIIQVISGVDER